MFGRCCLGGDHNKDPPKIIKVTYKQCANNSGTNPCNRSRFSVDCRTTRIKAAPPRHCCNPISTTFDCCRTNLCTGGNARQHHYCTNTRGKSRFSLHSKSCCRPTRSPKILCLRPVVACRDPIRRCLSDECSGFVRLRSDARFASVRSRAVCGGEGRACWSHDDFPCGDNNDPCEFLKASDYDPAAAAADAERGSSRLCRRSSSVDAMWSRCEAESVCADEGAEDDEAAAAAVEDDCVNWEAFEREIEARIRACPDFLLAQQREPNIMESSGRDPSVRDSSVKDSCATDSCARDPCARDPCARDPCPRDPCARDPCVRDSSVKDPCARDPCARDPCGGDPCVRDSSVGIKSMTESERHWNRLSDNVPPAKILENEHVERMRRVAGKLIENFIRKVKAGLESMNRERPEKRASREERENSRGKGSKAKMSPSKVKSAPAASERNSLSLPTIVLQPKTEKKGDSAPAKDKTSPEKRDQPRAASREIGKTDEKAENPDESSSSSGSSSGSSSSGSSSGSSSSGGSSSKSESSESSAEDSRADKPDIIEPNQEPDKRKSEQSKSRPSKKDSNVIKKTEAIKYRSAPPKHREPIDSKSSDKDPPPDRNQPKAATKEAKSKHGEDRLETSPQNEAAASSDNGPSDPIQQVEVDPEAEETLRNFATDVVKSLQTTIQYKLRSLVRDHKDENLKREILLRGDYELKNQILPTIVDHIVWIIKKEFRDKTEAQLKQAMSHDPGRYVDMVVTNAVMKTHNDLKAKRSLFKTIVVTSNCQGSGKIAL